MKYIRIDEERLTALYLLHQQNYWSEELLSDALFGKTVETVLTPRERFVLEEKVNGTSDKRIINILKKSSPQQTFSASTLLSYESNIKRKLRDGFEQRLPGWIKGKVWIIDAHDNNLWKMR